MTKGPRLGEMTTRRMRLADLKPADYNPRRMSDRALAGLGESMGRFGNMVPIVWNERSGRIVGGHQRYRRLMEDGQEETDVVVVNLDDNEEVALNIALNSRELRGDFTKEVVAQLALCEVRLGDAFAKVGLDDLYNFVRRMKFEGGEAGSGDGTGEPAAPTSKDVIPTGPDAVITCPRCRSSWTMNGNKVLRDATKGAAKLGEAGDA